MKAFDIITVNPEDIETFIIQIHHGYDKHDIFEASEPFNIKDHYHKDVESRLFLEGEAVFTIEGVEVCCSPGTYLEIGANAVHSFQYDGGKPLKVMRFFSENEDWQATFI